MEREMRGQLCAQAVNIAVKGRRLAAIARVSAVAPFLWRGLPITPSFDATITTIPMPPPSRARSIRPLQTYQTRFCPHPIQLSHQFEGRSHTARDIVTAAAQLVDLTTSLLMFPQRIGGGCKELSDTTALLTAGNRLSPSWYRLDRDRSQDRQYPRTGIPGNLSSGLAGGRWNHGSINLSRRRRCARRQHSTVSWATTGARN